MICIPESLLRNPAAARMLAGCCTGPNITLTTRTASFLVGSDGAVLREAVTGLPYTGQPVGAGVAIVGSERALRRLADEVGCAVFVDAEAGRAFAAIARRVQMEVDYLLPEGEVQP